MGDGSYAEGVVRFWSFTSDGKQSSGRRVLSDDFGTKSVVFEAQMPAGSARQAYWPLDEGEGFNWIVEAKGKKGWNRFMSQQFKPL